MMAEASPPAPKEPWPSPGAAQIVVVDARRKPRQSGGPARRFSVTQRRCFVPSSCVGAPGGRPPQRMPQHPTRHHTPARQSDRPEPRHAGVPEEIEPSFTITSIVISVTSTPEAGAGAFLRFLTHSRRNWWCGPRASAASRTHLFASPAPGRRKERQRHVTSMSLRRAR